MKRTCHIAGRTAALSAVLALGLVGCSYASPSTITTPYPASDGVGGSIGSTPVSLRNFLVVGSAKGAPAEVVGVLVNDGDTSVSVSLTADLGASAQPSQTIVTVPAHGITRIGPDRKTSMRIPELPVSPGALTGISAATAAGGSAALDVPVLLPLGPYVSLTPGPTPVAPAAPTPTPSSS